MAPEARSRPGGRGEPRITLDHVGIAVSSLSESLARWEGILPVATTPPEDVPGEGVRLSFVETAGARLELLESTGAGSAIARFLSRRPGGVHHLSFTVEGIGLDAWFEELRLRGVRLIGEAPREGAEGKRVFFVHPDATGGVLIEFSQRREGPVS